MKITHNEDNTAIVVMSYDELSQISILVSDHRDYEEKRFEENKLGSKRGFGRAVLMEKALNKAYEVMCSEKRDISQDPEEDPTDD